MSKLAERLSTLKSLPALPQTVIRLLRSLSGSTSDASDLEDIIKTDSALSATVLKFANAAAQATTRVLTLPPVASVRTCFRHGCARGYRSRV